jgi:hypothetical protein
MTGLRITRTYSLALALGAMASAHAAAPVATTGETQIAARDNARGETELEFLEFLGGTDELPPDPDAPFDEPVAVPEHQTQLPEGNKGVKP